MTPEEFLTARIAEGEALAQHSLDGDIEYLPSLTTKHGDVVYLGVPAREYKAKRAILNACVGAGFRVQRDDVLRALALPYADHPDYVKVQW